MRGLGWVAVAVLLAGCSSGSGTDGGGTTGGLCPTAVSANACIDGCNPCLHLTDAQVAAVVGQDATGTWNSDACEWDYFDNQDNLTFEVSFGINLGYADYEYLCHPVDQPNDPYMVTPLTGVGDDACYLTTTIGALGSELDFLKGCWGYNVDINGPAGQSPPFPDATVQMYEETLALDAVPTL